MPMKITLWTKMVPASPLRPAMPLGGGRAQSSPTITVCKCNILHVLYSTERDSLIAQNIAYLNFIAFRFSLLCCQPKIKSIASIILWKNKQPLLSETPLNIKRISVGIRKRLKNMILL